ncbi:putative transposable element, partial [Pseudoloma neurophilia]
MLNLNNDQIKAEIRDFCLILNKKCVNCGNKTRLKTKMGNILICTWKPCSSTKGLYKNTILDKFKKNFEFFIFLIKGGFGYMPLRGLSEQLNYKYRNLINFFKKIKINAKKNFFNNIEMIGGDDLIVEIDESKFGKRKYNRGHRVEGQWVLGIVERTEKRRIILIPVERRDSKTLTDIKRKYVHPLSIILTDKWKGYNELKKYFKDHKTVNHSKHFKDPETGVHTNTID